MLIPCERATVGMAGVSSCRAQNGSLGCLDMLQARMACCMQSARSSAAASLSAGHLQPGPPASAVKLPVLCAGARLVARIVSSAAGCRSKGRIGQVDTTRAPNPQTSGARAHATSANGTATTLPTCGAAGAGQGAPRTTATRPPLGGLLPAPRGLPAAAATAASPSSAAPAPSLGPPAAPTVSLPVLAGAPSSSVLRELPAAWRGAAAALLAPPCWPPAACRPRCTPPLSATFGPVVCLCRAAE